MPTEVIMPKVDMDMASGTISSWYVSAGSTVAKGDPLFAIETDKAAMDVEAPADGILHHPVAEGTTVDIGQAVGWLYAEDEEVGEPPSAMPGQSATADNQAETVDDAPLEQADPVPAQSASTPAPSAGAGKTRATPKARALARGRGIDLHGVVGSGPAGRIQADDIAELWPDKDGTEPLTAHEAAASALHVSRSVGGSGHPYVLIHGFASDATSWAALESGLGQRPIHRIELPGHGRSPMIRIASFSQLLDSVSRAFDNLGLEKVHLVGHSLGAALSLALADARPGAVDALTLIAPAGLGPDINGSVLSGICRATRAQSLKPWLQQLVHDERIITDSYVRLALAAREKPGLSDAQSQMADALFADGVQTFDLRAALSRVTIPTRIIWGKQDAIIPYKHALRAPGSVALHLFPDTGHLPQIEQTDEVASIIRRSSV